MVRGQSSRRARVRVCFAALRRPVQRGALWCYARARQRSCCCCCCGARRFGERRTRAAALAPFFAHLPYRYQDPAERAHAREGDARRIAQHVVVSKRKRSVSSRRQERRRDGRTCRCASICRCKQASVCKGGHVMSSRMFVAWYLYNRIEYCGRASCEGFERISGRSTRTRLTLIWVTGERRIVRAVSLLFSLSRPKTPPPFSYSIQIRYTQHHVRH